MPGDLELLPARVLPAPPGAGPALLAAELLGRVRAELPVIGELGERDQILVAAWLTGLRSARTRRAYAGDVTAWLGWLADRETGVLAAGRVHVDPWAATQLDGGAAASSVRRSVSDASSNPVKSRLSLSSWRRCRWRTAQKSPQRRQGHRCRRRWVQF
jgi:hypothetical protein